MLNLKASMLGFVVLCAFAMSAFAMPANAAETMKNGEMMMVTPDGKMTTMQMNDKNTMEMMRKEGKPMMNGMMIMMEGGKMYMMEDKKMSDGKMMSDMMMKK
jgi:hypothetical protein